MWSLKGALHSDKHFVGDGRVGCPVLHEDIDVERCYGCAFLRQSNESEGTIACRPPDRYVDHLAALRWV